MSTHLGVVARRDVADAAQRRRLHCCGRVVQQLNQPLADAGVDDGLDAIVSTIGKVAEGPARVRRHLGIRGRNELSESLKRRLDLLQLRLGLAAAEVGQRPRRVAQHRELRGRRRELEGRPRFLQLEEEGRKGIGVEDEVAAARRVARNVTKRPRRLLAHV